MSNKQLRHCKGSSHEIGSGFEHIDSDFENNKTLTYLDCFFFVLKEGGKRKPILHTARWHQA